MPLHERIRFDFEERIRGGVLKPGDRLPIESELMHEYGCSRMTVNKALSALAMIGLIERRKRAGTFVARPRMHSMVLDVPDITAQVRERGERYAYQPIKHVTRPPADDPDEKALAGRGALVQIDGLHLANDAPFAIEFRLISVAAVPEILDANFETSPPGTWLLQHVPWTEAETRISAVAAGREDARRLAIPSGSPCLRVERRTWRGNERVTLVRQLFPGDLYDMGARFGPSTLAR